MKIGILTLPLHTNYGGLLQAYALQTYLQRNGHEVLILNRKSGYPDRNAILEVFVKTVDRIRSVLSSNKRKTGYITDWKTQSVIRRNVNHFVERYLCISKDLKTTRELANCAKHNKLDAIIVGSDQVWRPKYSPMITNHFLDFAEKWDIKRIAYAASFGVDSWEYNQADTKRCSELAKKFKAISVREYSGILLCREYLHVSAIQVIDPTLLLSRDDYVKLIPYPSKQSDSLFCYILDKNEINDTLINKVSAKTSLIPHFCMPECLPTYENFRDNPESCVCPPVESWLAGFRDAKMVLCDSFHGCVFSIIFNKPFWVVGNLKRGMARFHSLLSQFGLEDRMIDAEKDGGVDFFKPINWDEVNKRKAELQAVAIEFLQNTI